MISVNSKIVKNPNIACSLNDGKYVLVPIVNNIADMKVIHTLNEVGSFIWNAIDNNRNLTDLIDLVVAEFHVPKEIAQKDILIFLEELEKKQIVSFGK